MSHAQSMHECVVHKGIISFDSINIESVTDHLHVTRSTLNHVNYTKPGSPMADEGKDGGPPNTPDSLDKDTQLDIDVLIEHLDNMSTAYNVVQDRDVVFLIGKTGSGKTTAACFLQGCEMSELQDREEEDEWGETFSYNSKIQAKNAKEGFVIGHTGDSETASLNSWEDSETKTLFIDSPGFEDTKKPEFDIANAIVIRNAMRRCKSVRIVILYHQPIPDPDRGVALRNFLHRLSMLLPNLDNYLESFAFFFSKVRPSEKPNDFGRLLDNFKTGLKSAEHFQKRKDLVKFIDEVIVKDLKQDKERVLLRPLDDKPQDAMKRILRKEKIKKSDAFEVPLGEKGLLQLQRDCQGLLVIIQHSLPRHEFQVARSRLDNLKKLSTHLEGFTTEQKSQNVDGAKHPITAVYCKGLVSVKEAIARLTEAAKQSLTQENFKAFSQHMKNVTQARRALHDDLLSQSTWEQAEKLDKELHQLNEDFRKQCEDVQKPIKDLFTVLKKLKEIKENCDSKPQARDAFDASVSAICKRVEKATQLKQKFQDILEVAVRETKAFNDAFPSKVLRAEECKKVGLSFALLFGVEKCTNLHSLHVRDQKLQKAYEPQKDAFLHNINDMVKTVDESLVKCAYDELPPLLQKLTTSAKIHADLEKGVRPQLHSKLHALTVSVKDVVERSNEKLKSAKEDAFSTPFADLGRDLDLLSAAKPLDIFLEKHDSDNKAVSQTAYGSITTDLNHELGMMLDKSWVPFTADNFEDVKTALTNVKNFLHVAKHLGDLPATLHKFVEKLFQRYKQKSTDWGQWLTTDIEAEQATDGAKLEAKLFLSAFHFMAKYLKLLQVLRDLEKEGLCTDAIQPQEESRDKDWKRVLDFFHNCCDRIKAQVEANLKKNCFDPRLRSLFDIAKGYRDLQEVIGSEAGDTYTVSVGSLETKAKDLAEEATLAVHRNELARATEGLASLKSMDLLTAHFSTVQVAEIHNKGILLLKEREGKISEQVSAELKKKEPGLRKVASVMDDLKKTGSAQYKATKDTLIDWFEAMFRRFESREFDVDPADANSNEYRSEVARILRTFITARKVGLIEHVAGGFDLVESIQTLKELLDSQFETLRVNLEKHLQDYRYTKVDEVWKNLANFKKYDTIFSRGDADSKNSGGSSKKTVSNGKLYKELLEPVEKSLFDIPTNLERDFKEVLFTGKEFGSNLPEEKRERPSSPPLRRQSSFMRAFIDTTSLKIMIDACTQADEKAALATQVDFRVDFRRLAQKLQTITCQEAKDCLAHATNFMENAQDGKKSVAHNKAEQALSRAASLYALDFVARYTFLDPGPLRKNLDDIINHQSITPLYPCGSHQADSLRDSLLEAYAQRGKNVTVFRDQKEKVMSQLKDAEDVAQTHLQSFREQDMRDLDVILHSFINIINSFEVEKDRGLKELYDSLYNQIVTLQNKVYDKFHSELKRFEGAFESNQLEKAHSILLELRQKTSEPYFDCANLLPTVSTEDWTSLNRTLDAKLKKMEHFNGTCEADFNYLSTLDLCAVRIEPVSITNMLGRLKAIGNKLQKKGISFADAKGRLTGKITSLNFQDDDNLISMTKVDEVEVTKVATEVLERLREKLKQLRKEELEVVMKAFKESDFKKVNKLWSQSGRISRIDKELKMLDSRSLSEQLTENFAMAVEKKIKDFQQSTPDAEGIKDIVLKTMEIVEFIDMENVQTMAREKVGNLLEFFNKKKSIDFLVLGELLSASSDLGRRVAEEFPQFAAARIVWWNQQTKGISFDDALDQLKVGGTGANDKGKQAISETEKKQLKSAYDVFVATYKELQKSYLLSKTKMAQNKKSLVSKTKKLGKELAGGVVKDWDSVTRKVPELLAHVFIIYASVKSPTATGEDSFAQPHAIQLLTVFRLLGLDAKSEGKWPWLSRAISSIKKLLWSSNLNNHLAQVITGGGKSIIIGSLAAMLALMECDVYVASYSPYLVDRDYKDFKDIFEALEVADRVNYNTLSGLVETLIGKHGNVRELTIQFVRQPGSVGTESKRVASVRPSVLIVDEVDMLFSDDFYGNTLNPVATITSENIESLFREIWMRKPSYAQVQTLPAYKKAKQEFESHAWNFFDQQVKRMVSDCHHYANPPYEIGKLENGLSVIGYSENGVINTSLLRGYRTAFAGLYEAERNRITKEAADRWLQISIPCGNYSYASLTKEFNVILGVTGTLEHLTPFERKVVQEGYKVEKLTFTPSIYGKSKISFGEKNAQDVGLEEKEADFFLKLKDEILLRRKVTSADGKNEESYRPVLVFFETKELMHKFANSSYGQQLEDLTNDGISFFAQVIEASNTVIKNSTLKNRITLFTASLGRGLDFVCRDSFVTKHGGVHVIQAFFSKEVSEEYQIKGRTARQSQPGSYSLVVCGEHLKASLELTDEELKKILDSSTEQYAKMAEARLEYSKKQMEQRQSKVNQAENAHKESMKHLQDLLTTPRNVTVVTALVKFLESH
eukprot:g56718.t1